MTLTLASQSPRRKALLTQLGLTFTVRVADIDETMTPGTAPEDAVAEVSARKAHAVAADAAPDQVIIAADTIVVIDGRILGKPHSPEGAAEMLRTLSGRTHQVMTGVTVLRGGRQETVTEISRVSFRPLTEGEIAAYIATGDPMDKAGSYGVQGLAAAFVERIDGDYFNVMGLPLCRLTGMLRRFGVTVLGEKG